MEVDASGWSGDGDFTQRLIDAIRDVPAVSFLRVEDAPASRGDAAFSFISNELFVVFVTSRRVTRTRRLGFLPGLTTIEEKMMTLGGLEASLAERPDIGAPEYSDEGMLQYLRAERITPAYQTRSYKLIELIRIYEAGTPRKQRGDG